MQVYALLLQLFSVSMASFVEGRLTKRPKHEIILGESQFEKMEVRVGDYVEFICPSYGGLTVYQVTTEQYESCELSSDELDDLKILECSNDGRGRLSLKIETYSASPDGYIFFPNEQYLYLVRPSKSADCEQHHKITMDVSERISRRLPHKKSPSKPKKTLLITTTPTTITSTTTTTAKTEPRKKQIKTPVVVPIVQVPRIGKYVSTSASAIYTYDSLLLILSLFIFKLII